MKKTHEEKYPMKLVARRTGLSPHAIRIWEKRYNAVSPERTSTNRRLYSEAEIERLLLLHKATLAGHTIGRIANLPAESLRKLSNAHGAIAPSLHKVATPIKTNTASTQAILDACIEHVKQLNPDGLTRVLGEAEVALSKPVLIEQIIVPLMHKIGELWRNGTLRVVHEHTATAVVRSFLGNIRQSFELPPTAPCIVITTPIGQLHELGALMAAATASSGGWRVTYLGPNLPAEEIAAAAKQNDAKAVGLSLVYPGDDARMSEEMRKLRRGVADEVTILVGGRAASTYHDIFESIDALQLNDMISLGSSLESLRLPQSNSRKRSS